MDDETWELDTLRKHGLALKKSIKSVNRDLDRAMHAVSAGKVGRALRILESRFRQYADLMFELGTVEEQIRALRVQEHEKVRKQNAYETERHQADDWQAQDVEDLLDWLPPLDEVPEPAGNERHPRHEEDERSLGQMHERSDYPGELTR